LRKLLKKYDWDRYFIAEQFIETGERALDIGCGNGCMLRKVNDKFQELYSVDIFPSRLRKAEDKVKKLFLKIFRNLNSLWEMQIILFLFQIIILILLFV